MPYTHTITVSAYNPTTDKRSDHVFKVRENNGLWAVDRFVSDEIHTIGRYGSLMKASMGVMRYMQKLGFKNISSIERKIA